MSATENWRAIDRVIAELTKADLAAQPDIDPLTRQPAPAQVSFMITRVQKQRLREMGHDGEGNPEYDP